MDWLTNIKIPIGPWAKWLVDAMTSNGKGFFDLLKVIMQAGIDAILFVMQAPFIASAQGKLLYALLVWTHGYFTGVTLL